MYNKFTTIGHVVADAQLKYLPSGTPIADFKVASNYKYGDTEEVLFMPCVLIGKIAESLAKYIVKGGLVFVEGRLREERWKSDGVDKSIIKLTANIVKLLGSNDAGAAKKPKEKTEPEPF